MTTPILLREQGRGPLGSDGTAGSPDNTRVPKNTPGPIGHNDHYSKPEVKIEGYKVCPGDKSQICIDTLERIKVVYGSLKEIKIKPLKFGKPTDEGGVSPDSPKTILIKEGQKDVVGTLRHELVHVRQFAEFFGDVSDDERREKLVNMAKRMSQEEWVEWNFQLEKEAFRIAAKIQDDLKSPADKRRYLQNLEEAAKKLNVSTDEVLEDNQKTIDNLIMLFYEARWIGYWRLLRGDLPELAPPYIPGPRLGR